MHKTFKELPEYSYSFMNDFTCHNAKEECWFNECANCKDGLLFQKAIPINMLIGIDEDEEEESCIVWYKWVTGEKATKGGKVMVTYVKKERNTTFKELHARFILSFASFKEHFLVKRTQPKACEINKKKVNLDETNAVIQFDFAENYSSFWQDEIQKAHYHKVQLTVFTGIIWFGELTKSYAIVSDTLSHDKYTIVSFIEYLLSNLPMNINNVIFWSDGPQNQFKNQFMASSITFHEKRHNIKITWKFFAASHGKGPVDGIGGAVKRYAAAKIIRRKHVRINNVETFMKAISGCKVSVHPFTKEDLTCFAERNDLDKLFQESKPISGIFKVHEMQVTNGKVTIEMFSRFEDQSLISAKEDTTDFMVEPCISTSDITNKLTLTIGDWCAAYIAHFHYWYIGIITAINDNVVTANFLQQITMGKNYFDTKEDISHVKKENVFYKLQAAPQSMSFTRKSKLVLIKTDFENIIEQFAKDYER